jgi:phytoene dehydrogenase-like protein
MKYDVVIVGAGHNGLVCAAYLARAGLSVKVVERRGVVGGAAVTEEFHPGFRNSVASYSVGLLHPKVVNDLDLYGHGLELVHRQISNFLPLEDGRYLNPIPTMNAPVRKSHAFHPAMGNSWRTTRRRSAA